jgi:hypothetical protein
MPKRLSFFTICNTLIVPCTVYEFVPVVFRMSRTTCTMHGQRLLAQAARVHRPWRNRMMIFSFFVSLRFNPGVYFVGRTRLLCVRRISTPVHAPLCCTRTASGCLLLPLPPPPPSVVLYPSWSQMLYSGWSAVFVDRFSVYLEPNITVRSDR